MPQRKEVRAKRRYNGTVASLSPLFSIHLEFATKELKGSIHLFFSETVQNQRAIEVNRPQQAYILIVVEDTFASSLESAIRATVFGMGNDNMFSEQVECLIKHLAHPAFIAWINEVRGIDHHLQVRRLHRGKQCMALGCCAHNVCRLRFKGQRNLLFLGNPHSSVH